MSESIINILIKAKSEVGAAVTSAVEQLRSIGSSVDTTASNTALVALNTSLSNASRQAAETSTAIAEVSHQIASVNSTGSNAALTALNAQLNSASAQASAASVSLSDVSTQLQDVSSNTVGSSLPQVVTALHNVGVESDSVTQSLTEVITQLHSMGASDASNSLHSISLLLQEASARAVETSTSVGDVSSQLAELNASRSTGSLGDLGATLQNTTLNAGEAAGALEDVTGQLGELNDATPPPRDSLSEVMGSINEVRDAIPSAVTALETLAVALLGVSVVNYLKNAIDVAARTEVLGTVLHVVAENAGYTAEQIDRVDKRVQAMGITAASSRESLTNFLQAGLDVNKAAELARAAQDLAVVAGENSSDTFARLILNVQQMDIEGLRFMGVVVNTQTALEDYARAIDKEVDSLSQSEKQQAFLNATLTESAKLTGTYEAAMGDVAKQVQSLDRLQTNLAKTVGDLMLPAYSAVVQEFSNFLKETNAMAEEGIVQEETVRSVTAAVKDMATTVREVAVYLVEHRDTIGEIIKYYLEFVIVSKGISTVVGIFTAVSGALTAVAIAGAEAAAGMTLLETQAAMTAGTMEVVTTRTTLASGAMALLKTEVTALTAPMIGFVAAAGVVGYALGDWLNQFAVVRNAGLVVVTAFMNGLQELELKIEKVGVFFSMLFTGMTWKQAEAKWKERNDKIAVLDAQLKDAQDNLYKGLNTTAADSAKKDAAEYERQSKKVIDTMTEVVNSKRELSAKEVQLQQVTQNGDAKGIEIITKQKDEIVKKLSKQEQSIKTKVDELKLTDDEIKQFTDKANKQAEEIELQEDFATITKEVSTAVTELGVESKNVSGQTLILGESFQKTAGTFSIIAENFKKSLDFSTPIGHVLINIRQLQLAVTALVAGASTPDEIISAYSKLSDVAELATATTLSLKENLESKFETSSINEMEEAVSGLISTQQELAASLDLIRSLENDSNDAGDKLTETILSIGGSSVEAINGVVQLGIALDDLGKQDIRLDSAINTSNIKQGTEEAKTLYDRDAANLSELYQRKKAIIEEGTIDEVANRKILDNLSVTEINRQNNHANKIEELDKRIKDSEVGKVKGSTELVEEQKSLMDKDIEAREVYAKKVTELTAKDSNSNTVVSAKLQALEKETLDKRIEATKSYYDAVKDARDKALSAWESYYKELRQLEEEKDSTAKTQAEYLLELTRKGMSEEELSISRRIEANRLAEESKAALLQGNYELAKELAAKRLEEEKDIIDATPKETMIDVTAEQQAYDSLQAIISKQQEGAIRGIQEQRQSYESLTNQVVDLKDKLVSMAKDQIDFKITLDTSDVNNQIETLGNNVKAMELNVSVSPASIQQAANYIRQQIEDVNFQFGVSANSSGGGSTTYGSLAKADGGYISGAGTETSDSILTRLSNGEFVIKAAAVRNVGIDFLNSINTMTVQPHQLPSFATGGYVGGDSGSSGGVREVVDLTLNIGEDTVHLSGERTQIRNMVNAFKRVGRGSV